MKYSVVKSHEDVWGSEGVSIHILNCGKQYTKHASFWAFTSVQLRSLFFWDVVPCHWVMDAHLRERRMV